MRTEAQVRADEALTAAIDAALKAYEYDEEGSAIAMEYVVLVAQQQVRNDDVEHSFSVIYRNNDVPLTHALGLLVAATDTLRSARADG